MSYEADRKRDTHFFIQTEEESMPEKTEMTTADHIEAIASWLDYMNERPFAASIRAGEYLREPVIKKVELHKRVLRLEAELREVREKLYPEEW